MKTALLKYFFRPFLLIPFFVSIAYATSSDKRYYAHTLATDAPAAPGEIVGLVEVCAGENAAYMVPAVSGATGYTWSVPATWAILSGQGTNQIIVRAGAHGGLLNVTANNAYGVSGSRHKDVIVAAGVPAKPVTLTGPTSLCAGGEATYGVQWMDDTRKYNWSVPAGWRIIGLQDTSHIKVVAGPGAGIVRVTALNHCGQSAATDWAVSVSQPVSNNTIDGSQTVCAEQAPVVLAGASPTGGTGIYTYLWESSTTSATAGFTAAAGANNNQSYTSGVLAQTTWFRRVVSAGSCQSSYSDVLKVEVRPVPAKPSIEQVSETEVRANIDGAAYEWLRDNAVLPFTTQTIPAEAAGVYQVRVRSTEGCFSPFSEMLYVTITSLADDARAMGVNIYPNPSSGKVRIHAGKPLQQVELQVISMLGLIVYQKHLPLLDEAGELELSLLPDGVYLLLLKTPHHQLKQKLLLQR